MAQIRHGFYDGDYTQTSGIEFLNKEGKSLLKVGRFNGDFFGKVTTKVFEVEENEQVIGIKAYTRRDPTHYAHGCLRNLQFKIAKLI